MPIAVCGLRGTLYASKTCQGSKRQGTYRQLGSTCPVDVSAAAKEQCACRPCWDAIETIRAQRLATPVLRSNPANAGVQPIRARNITCESDRLRRPSSTASLDDFDAELAYVRRMTSSTAGAAEEDKEADANGIKGEAHRSTESDVDYEMQDGDHDDEEYSPMAG